ncbi:YolD-like family protein [Staphylococcus caprae]|uniref:YolD-like family protein n=1 Tax=Staphylococcus caprae TaxID=29380 RepID=UPI000DFC00B3|nr:YolD-like family protein [Staphylococcus caprae]SUL89599.1 YolD-like protein family protein [Staphylococcus caprae]
MKKYIGKMHSGEKAIITYWKQGYFYDHQAYIKNVDILKQSMIISKEGGNETMEIPMKDIQNIE